MSIVIRKDGVELLLLKPIEFRRVYTLTFDEEGDTRLEYIHSDLIVELDSGAPAMVEIIQSQLNSGEYIVKCMPTETTVDFKLSKNSTECMKYFKELVFMNFPNLRTRDVYLNEDLKR
jgi:hypothetical protein